MNNEIRDILNAISTSRWLKAALCLFAVGVTLTLIVGVVQNLYSWRDATPPIGIASIDVWKLGMVTGTVGTATAFLVTLYVADRNYRRRRENIPHLSMTLALERAPTSQKYDVVVAMLDAENTGTGLCSIGNVEWKLSVLSPYDDADIDEKIQNFDSVSGDSWDTEFPWDTFIDAPMRANMNIEPGETEQLTYDFVIPAGIEVIIVSAYVENISEPKLTDGWYRRAVHIL